MKEHLVILPDALSVTSPVSAIRTDDKNSNLKSPIMKNL